MACRSVNPTIPTNAVGLDRRFAKQIAKIVRVYPEAIHGIDRLIDLAAKVAQRHERKQTKAPERQIAVAKSA